MGLKERRAEAEALLRRAQEAAEIGEALPPRTFARKGFAFLVAGLDLQVSILGKPIAPLELGMAELRGKLQAVAGPPPYRTEALSEAYTYPILLRDPDGRVTEAYLYHGEDGPTLGGDEADRPDWQEIAAILQEALAELPSADYEDRAWDPDAGAWIYYGVRAGEPFEDWVEGEDPPEWAE